MTSPLFFRDQKKTLFLMFLTEKINFMHLKLFPETRKIFLVSLKTFESSTNEKFPSRTAKCFKGSCFNEELLLKKLEPSLFCNNKILRNPSHNEKIIKCSSIHGKISCTCERIFLHFSLAFIERFNTLP